MSYVPEDARWFVAELVYEYRVDGDDRNVVRVNTVLVEAAGPEEAHRRALELGSEGNHQFENTDGRQVTVSFRGLRDLMVLHDGLEHGSELFYSEHVALPEDRIRSWIVPREQLQVFSGVPETTDVFHPEFRRGEPNLMPLGVAEWLAADEPPPGS